MPKKENHSAEPFKLTVFRSFEEMKATPFSFPSERPLAEWQAERHDTYEQLRSTLSSSQPRRIKKKSSK
jgi:hypothetical protein